MVSKKLWPWLAWTVVTLSMIGFFTYRWLGPDRRNFVPGQTTAGHYQIELDCNACHTPWMGVKEKACYDCHAAELKAANDSHPKNKFTDPRNADRLNLVKADDCVTCHREHTPDRTLPMGVTMPADYCYFCHKQTLKDRPSHKGFAFDSCATAGCHNYHDNTALYEGFLLKHAAEPQTKAPAALPIRDLRAFLASSGGMQSRKALDVDDHDAPKTVSVGTNVLHDWATTAHAGAGVNCTDCHMSLDVTQSQSWSDRLGHLACAKCHQDEVNGFLGGKHGMPLARGLPPMKPGLARSAMKPESAHRELACASCHSAHTFDTRQAAVESCLSCHNDDHSLAYKKSEHFTLWQNEQSGKSPRGSGVSCATCHLPRETHETGGVARVQVQHNQNLNLRPNEKMIRTVCLHCHGLSFTIDALADRALVQSNFIGQPARHIESIDLALRRQLETQNKSKPLNE